MYNRVMEREEVERITDKMIADYDAVYFDVMNRILEEVRNNARETTQHNLAQVALTELGLPKIP